MVITDGSVKFEDPGRGMSSWEEVTFPWRGKVNVQVKMKSALEQAMKIRMGSRDTVLLFLYLGSRWGG